MGQFANVLFGALLGWVRSAAAELWALVTNADGSIWLRWLLEHWLPLVLLLCLGGAVIDFIVYLIRWQPYRVWSRFLRRLTGKEADAGQEQAGTGRKWLYADGSVAEESSGPLQPVEEESLAAPVRPVRRTVGRMSTEKAYRQPCYPPQWQHTNEQGEQP